MSWAVHNVSNAHQVTDINVCCIIAHRSPPVDQQNSVSTVETDQPDDTIVDVQMNANESDAESDASIPSDPEDLVNSLEQHLLDSRKRRLEAERKVEELTEEVKRLREERKYIGSIVKRSRLHH